MSPDDRSLIDAIHAELLGSAPEELRDHRAVAAAVRRSHPLLVGEEVRALARAVSARSAGLGPLDPLLADPSVSEVMANGPGPVWIERHGRLELTDVRLSTRELDLLVERIVGPLGLRADRRAPMADARLADGSRVNIVVPPLAVDGTCITVRRFDPRPRALVELCPPGVAEFLSWAVRTRRNLVVSGGTGAGKTTLLNALGAELPAGERLVTVEDTAELRLPGDHVVRLEARPASADGVGEVALGDLVRNALRMRPDRIVVGEVRGAEAVDMLWAMNTGHEGSMTTCHANSAADAIRRLELMVLGAGLDLPLHAVRDQLAASLDLVVHVGRLDAGRRGVTGVAEVLDPPQDRQRVRVLADRHGLHLLPDRPPRIDAGPPPDARWCS